VAAVQALGEAHTPQAMAALWQMLEDKDREVRDAVQRLVGTRT
jgi:HEAT repeat protein